MIKGKLTIRFLSDYSVGSGIGDGYHADSLIARDQDDIPYLPGRAIKGALREGAALISRYQKDFKKIDELFFGTRSYDSDTNKSGIISVSSGRLSNDLRQLLLSYEGQERQEMVANLVQIRAQTALEENKQTKKGSLRGIECGVAGLEYEADISCEIPDGYDRQFTEQYLFCVCAAAKGMGYGRSRGFGEAEYTLQFEDGTVMPEFVTLPVCQRN